MLLLYVHPIFSVYTLLISLLIITNSSC
uniref:Uncharacterized protein n=1 Tax=Arundo donax TaxID=35708 RepID=A0A0A8ZZN9_ARUDO